MATKKTVYFAALAVLMSSAGCRKNAVDPGAFKSALNDYYSAKTVCLWPAAVKFPVQADTNNDDQTKGFDALTDAAVRARLPATVLPARKGRRQAKTQLIERMLAAGPRYNIEWVQSGRPAAADSRRTMPGLRSREPRTPVADGNAQESER